jgi:hypothetical protein
VIEVNQPDKASRRRRGKSDAIDAETTERAALSGRMNACAKTSDGPVEMIRMFKLAKAWVNQVTNPSDQSTQGGPGQRTPQLRESMSGLSRANGEATGFRAG